VVLDIYWLSQIILKGDEPCIAKVCSSVLHVRFYSCNFCWDYTVALSACHCLVSCNIVHMIVSFHAVRSCLQVCSVLKAW